MDGLGPEKAGHWPRDPQGTATMMMIATIEKDVSA